MEGVQHRCSKVRSDEAVGPCRLVVYDAQLTRRTCSVSVGCGLPIIIQMNDWSLTTIPITAEATPLDISMDYHLRIEQFRHRTSQALAASSGSSNGVASPRERLALYQLLGASFAELEREAESLSCNLHT